MKIELNSVPFNPNMICTGKPLKTTIRQCTDVAGTINEAAAKVLEQPKATPEPPVQPKAEPATPPVAPPTAPPAVAPVTRSAMPYDRPRQEQPLGFAPRALIAMANINKLPEPQPLGFAPRALIARANNANLSQQQPTGTPPVSPPRAPASATNKDEPSPQIPTFAEWYDSRYDDDDSDSAGFINNKMARRWLYDELFKDKK